MKNFILRLEENVWNFAFGFSVPIIVRWRRRLSLNRLRVRKICGEQALLFIYKQRATTVSAARRGALLKINKKKSLVEDFLKFLESIIETN